MRHVVVSVFAACASLVPAPVAAQPISEAFVECAVLVDLSYSAMPLHRDTVPGTGLDYAARQLMSGAELAARREGHADVPAYLDRIGRAKRHAWRAEGTRFVFTTAFRNWMGYCDKLAQSRDIALR